MGTHIHDSILCPDDSGHILLTAINPAYDFQKLPPHILIGQVESLTEALETPPGQDNNEHLILSVMSEKATRLDNKKALQRGHCKVFSLVFTTFLSML